MKYKRIVVKVGTSTITHPNGKLNIKHIDTLAKTMSDLQNMGHEMVLVTSAAIGVGVSKLGLTKRPTELGLKQAAAAVGQCELMHIYDKFFLEYQNTVAQILITRDVINTENRKQNVQNTLSSLISLGVIPIINENDSVSVEEIEFGDNDTLSAIVAGLCSADLLVLLSDIDGLYDKDPRKNENAKLIELVSEITNEIRENCGGAGSANGTGGMITKISAAELCFSNKIPMIITNGEKPELLYDIINGKSIGTLFKP